LVFLVSSDLPGDGMGENVPSGRRNILQGRMSRVPFTLKETSLILSGRSAHEAAQNLLEMRSTCLCRMESLQCSEKGVEGVTLISP
jgi:hypothetical protein